MNAKRIAKSRREVAKFIREHPDAVVVGGTLRDKTPEQAVAAMKKPK